MVVCVRRVRVETPVDRLDLRAGDIVYLDNIVFTARDRTLRMILEQGAPLELRGLAMYHCGPLIVSVGGVGGCCLLVLQLVRGLHVKLSRLPVDMVLSL